MQLIRAGKKLFLPVVFKHILVSMERAYRRDILSLACRRLKISEENLDWMYPDTGPLNAVVSLIQTRKPESAKNVIGLDSQQGNYYSSRQKAMLTLAIMLKRTGASA
jgi:hypothetical protein